MTEKQLEYKPSTKASLAESGALDKFQRESEELYKQYPPAKLHTKESGEITTSYDLQKRVCMGLAASTSKRALDDQLNAMYRRADAVSVGLPESATPNEFNARFNQVSEYEQHLDGNSWIAAVQRRQGVRDTYTKPYNECLDKYLGSVSLTDAFKPR